MNNIAEHLTLSIEQLVTVTGGGSKSTSSSTMPRTEVRDWLQACAASAWTAGREDANMGDPLSPKASNEAAINACNAGVAGILKTKK